MVWLISYALVLSQISEPSFNISMQMGQQAINLHRDVNFKKSLILQMCFE